MTRITTIRMPAAVITEAKVLFEKQRKPRTFEIRCDLVADVQVADRSEVKTAARLHKAPEPADPGLNIALKPARTVEYVTWNGGLWRPAVSSYNGFNKEELLIDESMLRVILAAEAGTKVPYNGLVARNKGLNFTNYRGLTSERADMKDLAFTLKDNPAKQVIEDGVTEANRQIAAITGNIVLIDGMTWQRTLGPRYAVRTPYNSPPRVEAAEDGKGMHGYLQYSPGRLAEAERMAARTAGRGVRDIPRCQDRIEIFDDAATRRDEVMVVENEFGHLWSNAKEMLSGLPISHLVKWGRLRDYELAVRNGDAEAAVPAMVALRDFADGLKAMEFKPYYADLRETWFKNNDHALHRVIDIELPRLGIAPGSGLLAAADEEAVGDLGMQAVRP